MTATQTIEAELRNGRWLCALHTQSIAGDPFGRDRQPST
jgi:hypothetical protein